MKYFIELAAGFGIPHIKDLRAVFFIDAFAGQKQDLTQTVKGMFCAAFRSAAHQDDIRVGCGQGTDVFCQRSAFHGTDLCGSGQTVFPHQIFHSFDGCIIGQSHQYHTRHLTAAPGDDHLICADHTELLRGDDAAGVIKEMPVQCGFHFLNRTGNRLIFHFTAVRVNRTPGGCPCEMVTPVFPFEQTDAGVDGTDIDRQNDIDRFFLLFPHFFMFFLFHQCTFISQATERS